MSLDKPKDDWIQVSDQVPPPDPYYPQRWEYEKQTVGNKFIERVDDFSPDHMQRLEENRQVIYLCELGEEDTPFFVFRDHDSSYNCWAWLELERNENTSKMNVIHIDAHADLPWNQGFERFPKPYSGNDALKKLAGFSNYLVPAIIDGYVGSLYWLGAGTDSRWHIVPHTNVDKTKAWVKVNAETDQPAIPYFMVHAPDSLVEQTNTGFEGKYVLDIDLDYFLDFYYLSGGLRELRGGIGSADSPDKEVKFQNRFSSTMEALREIIRIHGKPMTVTVAYSPAYCCQVYHDRAYGIVRALIELIQESVAA